MFGLFRSTPRNSCRPLVEPLEDRAVPATFLVTNLSDHNLGSLRAAVFQANNNPGRDTVEFVPGLTGTIFLTTGEIDITDDVRIAGPGSFNLAVNGRNNSRIFDLESPRRLNVVINKLKLTRGCAQTSLDGFDGGAIRADNDVLKIRNSVLTRNCAEGNGGAVFANGGKTIVYHSTFARNEAGEDGGGVYNSGIFKFDVGLVLRNSADGSGGGLFTVGTARIAETVIERNTAGEGGGGLRAVGGSGSLPANVVVRYSTAAQNTAQHGGGIDVDSGTLTVRNSTVSGNRAVGGKSSSYAFNGGGAGFFLRNVDATIVNSTVSANLDRSATPDATTGGGGLHLYGGTTTLRNCTIAFNETVGQGGGIFLRDPVSAGTARLSMVSTIVSNSTAPAGNFDVARNHQGFASAAFCLIQRPEAGFFNGGTTSTLLEVNPMLMDLAENPGIVVSPTFTHALAPGSPAIDAGSNPEGLNLDQRGPGFPRVKGGGIDIGGFEL